VAALAYAGGTAGSALWLQIVVAIAAPCAVAAVWAEWVAPKAPRRLPDPGRPALEVVLFLAAGLALVAAGRPGFGVALAVVAIANAVLVRPASVSGERS
jgi:Protein of unknown function (DUF2568)